MMKLEEILAVSDEVTPNSDAMSRAVPALAVANGDIG